LRLGRSEAISGKCRLKPQCDAQTGCVVDQLDAYLMERGDRFDQAEAESASRRTAAAFQPIKALKYTNALFGRDSRPAIVHGHSYRARRFAGY